MSLAFQERDMLDPIIAGLQADGFKVYVQPSRHVTPPFLRDVALPDAIAVRKDKKIIIEVLRRDGPGQRKLERMQSAMQKHSDEWELRVYWIDPSKEPNPIALVSKASIDATIEVVENLVGAGNTAPALLMCWAALEAIGRALLPTNLARPQTPGRLVETLATHGHLAPNEADCLRQLAGARNALIHGDLRTMVQNSEVEEFLGVLKTLVGLLPD